MSFRRFNVVRVAPVAVLLFIGCEHIPFGTRPIGEVRKAAPSLEGKSVKVRGQVVDTNQLPYVGTRFYKLQDKTGELWVTTKDSLPEVGETLVVSGELHNAAVLGGASMGIQIRERSRTKARS